MGQVNVQIDGRSYAVACRDGEEPRLTRLAGHLNRKAEELSATLGQMSEPRMLLMAGLLVADELFELREGPSGAPSADPRLAEAFERLAERIEALATRLEETADAP